MREVAVHLKKLKGAWNNQCKLCRLIHLNHQSVLENQLKVVLHRKRMVLDINHQQKVLFWSKKVKKKFRRICTHLQPNRMKALLQINRQCWLKLIKMNHRELFRQKVRHILVVSIILIEATRDYQKNSKNLVQISKGLRRECEWLFIL